MLPLQTQIQIHAQSDAGGWMARNSPQRLGWHCPTANQKGCPAIAYWFDRTAVCTTEARHKLSVTYRKHQRIHNITHICTTDQVNDEMHYIVQGKQGQWLWWMRVDRISDSISVHTHTHTNRNVQYRLQANNIRHATDWRFRTARQRHATTQTETKRRPEEAFLFIHKRYSREIWENASN